MDLSRLLEEKTRALGGVKILIAENHDAPETFWSIYNRPAYTRINHRTDPDNLFRDLYQKFHFANPRRTPSPAEAPSTRAVTQPDLHPGGVS